MKKRLISVLLLVCMIASLFPGMALTAAAVDAEEEAAVAVLEDAAQAVGDEEIVMEMSSPVSPCLIKPVEGDSFTYLVLPVRISAN